MSEDKKKSTDYAAMERPIFEAWKDAGYFQRTPGFGEHADESYTIVIPPPNITGVLHMGHALNDTIQDACIRRARMRGFKTRWIIGTDHAGISTQTKVDKRLAEQGISRLEIGREAFIEECYKWREEYGTTIVNQIKGMGCSCDYSDEHFTLEPAYVRAVRKLFTDWYHEDIIYRGKRIVNWCPHCTTAIADDEAEYVDEAGHLWYLRYPLAEPVDGLDPVMRRQVWSLLMGDVADHGTTVLVSSHNLRELEDVCDHVGILSRGKVLIERSLSALQENVVKMQVVFQEKELPQLPGDLQVLHVSQVGRIHTLIIRGNATEITNRLAAFAPILMEALPLTLEEIFIYELGGEDYAVRDIVL